MTAYNLFLLPKGSDAWFHYQNYNTLYDCREAKTTEYFSILFEKYIMYYAQKLAQKNKPHLEKGYAHESWLPRWGLHKYNIYQRKCANDE
jgi:hypothetical protein